MKARVTRLAFLAALALGPYLSALQAAPPAASLFRVDTDLSRVYIRVDRATRFGHVHGIQGRLAASRLSLGGAGQMVFDMTTFQADTPEARRYVGLDPEFAASDAQKVTANMLGQGVLDVAHHPQAVYEMSAITPLDGQAPGQPGRYQVTGQFTLHGVAQPLQFSAQVQATDKPGVLRMRGQFAILQTKFGIQPYSALGGLARCADELQIWGDLVLTPAR